jgi:preprotein translocase subunit SecD
MTKAVRAGALLILLATAARAQDVPVAVEFRFVVDCGATDASPQIKDVRRGESYCLSRKILLDEDDVDHAEPTTAGTGDPAIRLRFTDRGAKRLLKATEDKVGERLGMVVNSRLLAAPVIRGPLGQEIVMIGLGSPEEAEAIARALNRKIPPN